MKFHLSLFLILICTSLFSQSIKQVKKSLRKTNSIEQAIQLRKDQPNWNIKITTSDRITAESELNALKTGKLLSVQEDSEPYLYKLVDSKIEQKFHVSHIYFDGTTKTIEEINSIRNTIISDYKAGQKFSDLSKKYSMYAKPSDGDLGWFKTGDMVEEFEAEIKKYNKGDIFRVDIPSRNWYYVILKTEDDKTDMTKYYIGIKF